MAKEEEYLGAVPLVRERADSWVDHWSQKEDAAYFVLIGNEKSEAKVWQNARETLGLRLRLISTP